LLILSWVCVGACDGQSGESATAYPLTIRLENPSNAPIAVGSCGPPYSITSAADDHRLSTGPYCAGICPKVLDCVSGSCPSEPTSISSTPLEQRWDGFEYVTRTVPGGSCADKVPVKAGRYHISVPVYRARPFETGNPKPLYTVVVDFSLPAPGGVVHVPLDEHFADAGREPDSCIPVVARVYDESSDCYGPATTLDGVCLEETEPETTTGLTEIACLSAPDGKSYATVKGYTQCLVTKYAGWSAEGDMGLCETQATGGCAAAVSRGYWSYGVFGPATLDFANDVDAGNGPRGDRVGECP
jgi:hypothetical protein